MRLLPLALLATLASCSVLLDSQYGIRLEPLPRGPRSDAQSIESVSPREAAVAVNGVCRGGECGDVVFVPQGDIAER